MTAQTTIEELCRMWPSRPLDAHKGTMGHAYLIAGSYGMAGAALLASRACMRSGVGKLTVRTIKPNRTILQLGVPEAILDLRDDATDELPADMTRFQAVAVGPAIDITEDSASLVKNLFQTYVRPVVIDADAITILSANRELLDVIPPLSVLTPHKLELKRLIGPTKDERHELSMTIEFAMSYNVIVVMKGPHSKIVCPSGQVYVNTTGNPGMATAGSGDVLTGMLLSFLAQGCSSEVATRLAVYLHGAAGDLAAAKLSEDAMMASDIVDFLPLAIKDLRGAQKRLKG